MAGILIPLMIAQGIAQSMQQNNQQRRDNRLQDTSIEMQRARFVSDEAQRLRDNARQDAQGAALNPARANILNALAQRFGLPAGALGFTLQQQAPRSSGPGMPPQAAGSFQQQAQGMMQQNTRITELQRALSELPTSGRMAGAIQPLRTKMQAELAALMGGGR